MRSEGKTKVTLRFIMFKDSTETLAQYLSIYDSLGAITTYKVIEDNEKFQGYKFTIKLPKL